MNILVCVKPVPDPDRYGDLRIDNETKRLVREGIPTVINPTDRNALEAALNLTSSMGGTVTVLSMTPEFCKDKIVESLAMGADEGYILSDIAFGGADTYATSYVLAQGIRAIEKAKGMTFDLILAGNESADGATSHVPVQVAQWLKLPHAAGVNRITVEEGLITVSKKGDGCTLEYRSKLPAVVAVSREINKPRFVNAMGIIKARKKPLTVWSKESIEIDDTKIGLAGSPTQAGELIVPDMSRKSQLIEGEPEEVADAIMAIIRKAGV